MFAYRVYYAVLEKFHDELGFLQEDTTVAVKVVNPPGTFGRGGVIKRNQIHLVMGQFECVTHDLIVDEDGYIRAKQSQYHHLQAYNCMDLLFSDACL